MKYITNDGKQYFCETPDQLVKVLMTFSKTPTDSVEEFMVQTSQRCLMQNASIIPVDSAEAFVEGLIKAGFLMVVEDGQQLPSEEWLNHPGRFGSGLLLNDDEP